MRSVRSNAPPETGKVTAPPPCFIRPGMIFLKEAWEVLSKAANCSSRDMVVVPVLMFSVPVSCSRRTRISKDLEVKGSSGSQEAGEEMKIDFHMFYEGVSGP